MTYSVYALYDPAMSDHVRYVGVSSYPELRLFQHLEEALVSNAHTWKLNWIRSLQRKGRDPEIRVLCTCETRSEALIQEQHFIRELRARSHRLTNATAGGEGLFGILHPHARRAKHRCSICGTRGHNRLSCKEVRKAYGTKELRP